MRKQVRSAVLWSGVDLFLRQGVGFAITIVLARLLTPEDFGTIALLAFFTGLASLFADAGFSAALIQKQDATHVDESTVFWFNMVASLIVSLILITMAPWIASFFDIEVLQSLVYLMAAVLVVSALGSIHQTLLTKALDFKTQAKIGFVSMLVAAIVAVYMAYRGYGVWALAGQTMVSAFVTTLLLWAMHRWKPMLVFNVAALKGMFGFSGYIFAAQFLQVLYDKGYGLLLGKFFGVAQLGVFDRADRTQRMVSETMTGVVAKVTFPLYSRYSNEQEKLRQIVQLSVRSMMLVMAPVMLGLLIVADILIPTVFGEQWLAAVSIFQVLCVVGLFYPLQSVNVSVLKAQGRADLNFRLNVIKKVTGISLLILGSYWGVMGIAWAMVAQSIVALWINGHYSKKLLGYGAWAQVKDCLPSMAVAGLMAGVVYECHAVYQWDGVFGLLALVLIGLLFYLAVNVLFKMSAFYEAVGFIKGNV